MEQIRNARNVSIAEGRQAFDGLVRDRPSGSHKVWNSIAVGLAGLAALAGSASAASASSQGDLTITGTVAPGNDVNVCVSGLASNGTWILYENSTTLTQPHTLSSTGAGCINGYNVTGSPLEGAVGSSVYAKDSAGNTTQSVSLAATQSTTTTTTTTTTVPPTTTTTIPTTTTTSAPTTTTTQQSPATLQMQTIGGLLFVANSNMGAEASSGTVSAPYQVWRGWQGPGIYGFPSRGMQTAIVVNTLMELDQYNIALTGQNLGSPYTLPSQSASYGVLGTLNIPGTGGSSSVTLPINVTFGPGFYSLLNQNAGQIYDQTIVGTVNVSCSGLNAQMAPPSLVDALWQDPSLNMPNGCPQIPFGEQVPWIPIGYVSFNNSITVSLGVTDVFTITPTINFNNLSNSTLTLGAGYLSQAVTLSFPSLFYANVSAAPIGAGVAIDANGMSNFQFALPAASTQLITVNNGATSSSQAGCALETITLDSTGQLIQNTNSCNTSSTETIPSGTLDTATITGQGAYGSSTNPIQTGDWLTSVGINWYSAGYYTMPAQTGFYTAAPGQAYYFNTEQDLVNYIATKGYTHISSSEISQGTSSSTAIQPNVNGIVTWYGPAYYNLTNQQANGGNPTGVCYISNPEYIEIYNQNIGNSVGSSSSQQINTTRQYEVYIVQPNGYVQDTGQQAFPPGDTYNGPGWYATSSSELIGQYIVWSSGSAWQPMVNVPSQSTWQTYFQEGALGAASTSVNIPQNFIESANGQVITMAVQPVPPTWTGQNNVPPYKPGTTTYLQAVHIYDTNGNVIDSIWNFPNGGNQLQNIPSGTKLTNQQITAMGGLITYQVGNIYANSGELIGYELNSSIPVYAQ